MALIPIFLRSHSIQRLLRLRTLKPALLVLVACVAGTAQATEYTVQIGAFGDRPNPTFAERAAQYGELLVLRGGDGITRVSIGRYDNRSAAREALARLQAAGYGDAYVANVRGRDLAVATPATSGTSATNSTAAPAPAAQPARVVRQARTIPTAKANQTTPAGRAIIAPKTTPVPTAATSTSGSGAKPDSNSQQNRAGRFRLRTHDTQSGETRDLTLSEQATANSNQVTPGSGRGNPPTVAGMGVNDIPQHLRDKLVYLDGVPHIKDGDRFIPLNDAVDGK